MSINNSPIIVALDIPEKKQLFSCLNQLDPKICRVKIGKSLFTQYGPKLIREIHSLGFEIFLDLKFHDIPHQVKLACEAVCELNIWMLSLHAMGGSVMLASARNAVEKSSAGKPLLVAVTILTSLDVDQYAQLGFVRSLKEHVLYLSEMAFQAGMDGVVSSAHEAAAIKQATSPNFLVVTPGIRLSEAEDDQARVMTPELAVQQGSNYLVIGRPITNAPAPGLVLQNIYNGLTKI